MVDGETGPLICVKPTGNPTYRTVRTMLAWLTPAPISHSRSIRKATDEGFPSRTKHGSAHDWPRAFGEVSFGISFRPLRSPVSKKLSTGSPYCVIRILPYHLISFTCSTFDRRHGMF